MAIQDLVLSYPDFKLNEIIDPEQFDINNNDIKNKINEIIAKVNQQIATADLADGAVVTIKLADNAVATAKIADGAVTTLKLGDLSVVTSKIADGAITSIKLADGSVITSKIANGAVTAEKIDPALLTSVTVNTHRTLPELDHPDGSVKTRHIANGAITASHIADGAITASKLSSDVFGTPTPTTAILSKGQNKVSNSYPGKSPFAILNLKGRTLVNLLGRGGNCDDLNRWTLWQSTIALDSTNKSYGSNSLKVTIGAGFTSGAGLLTGISVYAGRYYLLIGEVKNGNATNGGSVLVSTVAGSSTVASTDTTKFTTVYSKFSPISDALNKNVECWVSGSQGQYAYFDGIRLYEIDQATYNKIDVDPEYTGDKLAEKFPYVDDVKHINYPYIIKYGKNLLPPFTEWVSNGASGGKFSITDPYSAILDSTAVTGGVEFSAYVDIPVIGGQPYTINNPSTGRMRISEGYDNGYSPVIQRWIIEPNTVRTITFSSSTKIVRVVITNLTTYTDEHNNATWTYGTLSNIYTNPIFNLGSTALPFEPRNDDVLYIPTYLASNVDGTVYDTFYERDGQIRKLARFREMVLDGSLSWVFAADYTGYKSVALASVPNSQQYSARVVKYDGKIIPEVNGTFSGADQATLAKTSNDLYITIADTDSGWGESYTPTAQEIKDYFTYGRDLCTGGTPIANAGSNVSSAFDNSSATWWTSQETNAHSGVSWIGYNFGTKRAIRRITLSTYSNTANNISSVKVQYSDNGSSWSDVGTFSLSTSYTKNVLDISTTISAQYWRLLANANLSSNPWIVPEIEMFEYGGGNYKLIYQLATEVEEVVQSEGKITLHDGDNQVEFGEGLVVREVVNPQYYATNNSYYINDQNIVSGTSKLKYRANKLLSVYKNGIKDSRWIKYVGGGSYGNEEYYMPASDFDPTATYTVDYLVLDKHAVSTNVIDLQAEYSANLKTSVDKTVQDLSDLKRQADALAITVEQMRTNKDEEPWIAPTLQNGWVNYGSLNAPAGYYKDANGLVHVRGLIKSGTTTTSTVLFTLPAGYRPAFLHRTVTNSYNGSTASPAYITIEPDGDVMIDVQAVGNTWLNIDLIPFRAEQ